MKKLLIYIAISLIAPLVVCALIISMLSPIKFVGYVYITGVLGLMVYFTNMIVIENKKLDKDLKIVAYIFLAIFNLAYILSTMLVLKNVWVMIVGAVVVNFSGVIIHKIPLLSFILPLGVYPAVFSGFGVNETTLIYYLVVVLLVLGYSLWKKFRKTKIYLDDNY